MHDLEEDEQRKKGMDEESPSERATRYKKRKMLTAWIKTPTSVCQEVLKQLKGRNPARSSLSSAGSCGKRRRSTSGAVSGGFLLSTGSGVFSAF